MTVYYSVWSFAVIHMAIGMVAGIASVAWALHFHHPRHFLTFGGELVTWGDPKRWVGWYLVALLFEVMSSIGQGFYVEVALSAVEALFIVLGAFIVDRFVRCFE